MSLNIIVKSYEHVNRSLPNWDTPKGKVIRSKAHYESELRKHNMVPYEQAREIAKNVQENKRKEYKLSDQAREIIQTAKSSADKDGNVQLSVRTIEAMEKMGMSFKVPREVRNQEKGGMYAS